MRPSKKYQAYAREFARRRIEAAERDGGRCVLCGGPAAEVHHIVYRSHGGTNDLDNLACLCLTCHRLAHGVDAKEIREILRRRCGGGELPEAD